MSDIPPVLQSCKCDFVLQNIRQFSLSILAGQWFFKVCLLEVRVARCKASPNSLNHGEYHPFFWPQESQVLVSILGVGSSLEICMAH